MGTLRNSYRHIGWASANALYIGLFNSIQHLLPLAIGEVHRPGNGQGCSWTEPNSWPLFGHVDFMVLPYINSLESI